MVAPVKRAEEVLCLMPDVAQVWPRREVTSGHDEPPSRARGPLASGKGGSFVANRLSKRSSGGLGPVRGREAPCTPGQRITVR